MPHVTTNKVARFSAGAAEHALRVACHASGLDHTNAELIRLGENALFRLSSQPVVVRIARTMDYWADAVKEVVVAHWLAEYQFPAAQVHEVPQPVCADGHPVTFWRYIPGRPGNQGDVTVLGSVLYRLHRTPRPTTFDLPGENILGRVDRRIESAPVSAADKDFLLRRLEELRSELPRLRFPLSPAPIHGDAHVKNLMFRDDQPILIDFERFAWGQPEWDLALAATEYQTAGWWTHTEYSQFVEAYGYDVTSWKNFDVLRAAHEIKMTTWIMQNVDESAEIAREYHTRMRTIRRGLASASDRWHPF